MVSFVGLTLMRPKVNAPKMPRRYYVLKSKDLVTLLYADIWRYVQTESSRNRVNRRRHLEELMSGPYTTGGWRRELGWTLDEFTAISCEGQLANLPTTPAFGLESFLACRHGGLELSGQQPWQTSFNAGQMMEITLTCPQMTNSNSAGYLIVKNYRGRISSIQQLYLTI